MFAPLFFFSQSAPSGYDKSEINTNINCSLCCDCFLLSCVYFQATKDCVAKTLKRLEEKINGRVSLVTRFIYIFCLQCAREFIPLDPM
jgi:hypothetical protein